jgi:hypothetical protein
MGEQEGIARGEWDALIPQASKEFVMGDTLVFH